MKYDFVGAIKAEIVEPFGRPTDIIGLGEVGRNVAKTLLPVIGEKEICFFDEEVKSDLVFHYLGFADMLEKTEIMIFTIPLSKKYYEYLNQMNKNVKIFIPREFEEIIAVFRELQYNCCLV